MTGGEGIVVAAVAEGAGGWPPTGFLVTMVSGVLCRFTER